jgi:imidazolonepropionase-like amidohydrolase
LLAANEIVDGRHEVIRAAREQLRRGATQIKVFASGGVIALSGLGELHDLADVEFSTDEMAAAVEVAADHGTYVMAHCQTARAVNRAIDAGVRSIEHGVMLDEQSVERIAAAGAFLVPTLSVYEHLGTKGDPHLEDVKERYKQSVLMAHEAGVALGSGSDCWGGQHPLRGRELALKAAVVGNLSAVMSATAVNARLFGLDDELGSLELGKRADVILVEGNPLDDISVLGDPNRVRIVIKAGAIQKHASERETASRDSADWVAPRIAVSE